MKWIPDTCHCVIITEAPSKNGKFKERCKVHTTTRNTTDVYEYNKLHQERTEPDDKVRDEKKRATKEATRP